MGEGGGRGVIRGRGGGQCRAEGLKRFGIYFEAAGASNRTGIKRWGGGQGREGLGSFYIGMVQDFREREKLKPFQVSDRIRSTRDKSNLRKR